MNIRVGTITKEQLIKMERSVRREEESEYHGGFISNHKVFKSEKDYTRKKKHGKNFYDFD